LRLYFSLCGLVLILHVVNKAQAQAQINDQIHASGIPPGLIINWDCTEWFMTRPAEEMTTPGLQVLVDHYAGTQVSSLFFNPTSQRTAYASKAGTGLLDKRSSRLQHGFDP